MCHGQANRRNSPTRSGEAECARTSLNRSWSMTLGAAERNCTVTSGGEPILHVEDALSSYALSAATGELTVTDCTDWFSDGEDMLFTAKSYPTCTPQLQHFCFFFRSTKICAALTRCFADVVNGRTCSSFPAPELYSNPQSYQKESQNNRLDFFNQVFRQQILYPSKFALLSLRISRSFPLSFCFNSSHSRLCVPSPKLGVPRSGSETKLSNRRFSCRVLPPQLAATADVWKDRKSVV